jgi:hypothetical protein
MDRDIYLTDAQFLAGLRRIRGAIASGRKFHFVDSDTIGDKHTHCSWGACGDEPEDWPDPEALMWPDRRLIHGKVTPKYQKDHQHCPFERREQRDNPSGCFYRCLAWKRTITRTRALKLYDEEIAELEKGGA